MRAIFNLFDSIKNDGNITKPEMVKFLENLGVTPSAVEVDELFNMFDSNGNGQIDFAEFLNLMTKTYERTEAQKL